MSEVILSEKEKKLYNFIKERKEVTIKTIETELGSKFIGAIGGLISRGIVEGYKKRPADGLGYGVKYIKFFKIKRKR